MTSDDQGAPEAGAAGPAAAGECSRCGYHLAGLGAAGVCPECGTPYTGRGVVQGDWPCLRCGYSLTGLPESGSCPECGAAVVASLRGPLLEYSSPEYVASLHRGVFIVEVGIALGVLSKIGLVLGTLFFMAMRGGGGPPAWAYWSAETGAIALNLLSLAGWWLLSTPDPAFVGRDSGSRARRVLRAALVVSAAAACASLATTVLVDNPRAVRPGPDSVATPLAALALLAQVVQLGSGIAWIVQFFAAMKYLQWLGPRIPDRTIVDRARQYLWLLPLLYVLLFLCIGLGPLIALVMYVTLLDRLRARLRLIRRRMEPGDGAGVVA